MKKYAKNSARDEMAITRQEIKLNVGSIDDTVVDALINIADTEKLRKASIEVTTQLIKEYDDKKLKVLFKSLIKVDKSALRYVK